MEFFKKMMQEAGVCSLCMYIAMFLINTFFQFVELMKSMSGADAFLLLFVTVATGFCGYAAWVLSGDD